MVNFDDYTNNRVQELPRDFVQDIIFILNKRKETICDKQYKLKNAETEKEKEVYIKIINELQKNQNTILSFLNSLGIYPAYNWPQHRKEYFFPTQADCEMLEDWLWQCHD